jgi:hypothetical protein
MNRWHARLAELHRAVIRFPDGVQNVQNVQNALAGVAFEQFEHSEQRSDDCKGRPDAGQERAVVEWPNHHSPRAGQTVELAALPLQRPSRLLSDAARTMSRPRLLDNAAVRRAVAVAQRALRVV